MSGAAFHIPIFFLLGGLSVLGPLSLDASLPAIPAMAAFFRTDTGAVQMTVGALSLGVAVGHLVYGPVSDRFGRRPVLLFGLTLYTVSAAAAAFAPGIEALAAIRFVQGLAAAAGFIITRAIVRDLYDREGAARMLAYLMVVLGLMPVVGPVIGGHLSVWFGWRSVFVLMAAYCGLLTLVLWRFLDETLQRSNQRALRPLAIVGNFARILANRSFLGYLVCSAGSFGGLFAILSGSAPVLIEFLGQSPDTYGYEFALMMVGHLLAAAWGGRMVVRLGIDRLVFIGALVCVLAGLAMFTLAMAGIATLAAIMAPVFVFMVGFALVMPHATAGALSPFPEMAGTASALLGFFQLGVGSSVAILVGAFADGTQMPMTVAMAVAGLVSLAGFGLVVAWNAGMGPPSTTEARRAAAVTDRCRRG